ncbi:MAG: hypothetical protein KDC26_04815 [Armatimonadetes bacterium]|nr:hypothetical protein [Armatimonadota bacterium]
MKSDRSQLRKLTRLCLFFGKSARGFWRLTKLIGFLGLAFSSLGYFPLRMTPHEDVVFESVEAIFWTAILVLALLSGVLWLLYRLSVKRLYQAAEVWTEEELRECRDDGWVSETAHWVMLTRFEHQQEIGAWGMAIAGWPKSFGRRWDALVPFENQVREMQAPAWRIRRVTHWHKIARLAIVWVGLPLLLVLFFIGLMWEFAGFLIWLVIAGTILAMFYWSQRIEERSIASDIEELKRLSEPLSQEAKAALLALYPFDPHIMVTPESAQ